jgi:hypothetical protein
MTANWKMSKESNKGMGRFPRAYVNNVVRDDDQSFIIYQGSDRPSPGHQLEVGGIGFRSSGLPEAASTFHDGLDHVENRHTGGDSWGTRSTGPMPILKGKGGK